MSDVTVSANVDTFLQAADFAAMRTALGVDAAGTDNSTDVTFTGSGTYISLSGQQITVDPITVSDITDFDTEVSSNSAVAANTAKATCDTTNVTAAGALMDSEVTNLAQVKAFSSSDYVQISGTQTISGPKTFSNDVTITGSSLLMEGNDIYLDSSQYLQIHDDGSGNIELTGGALKASFGATFESNYVYFDSSASDYILSSGGTMQIYAGGSGLELYGSLGLYMPFLPTSNPGGSDQVWNDGGTLKIT